MVSDVHILYGWVEASLNFNRFYSCILMRFYSAFSRLWVPQNQRPPCGCSASMHMIKPLTLFPHMHRVSCAQLSAPRRAFKCTVAPRMMAPSHDSSATISLPKKKNTLQKKTLLLLQLKWNRKRATHQVEIECAICTQRIPSANPS